MHKQEKLQKRTLNKFQHEEFFCSLWLLIHSDQRADKSHSLVEIQGFCVPAGILSHSVLKTQRGLVPSVVQCWSWLMNGENFESAAQCPTDSPELQHVTAGAN